jgi:CubicO group peptidase (beta-lactamase class C family)
MDSQVLAQIEPYIQEKAPACWSFLIVKNGALVYERYFRNWSQTRTADIQSVTKSFTSALTGIAVGDGAVKSIDETVAGHYPEYFTPFLTPAKWKITIRHCLTMTSGWTENAEDRLWKYADDWREATILSPLRSTPGTSYFYRNGPVHLVAGIVEKQTRKSLYQYAKERLFDPLGIVPFDWSTDRQGHPSGAFGLQLTPRDMAKFGYLFLREGRWEGRQIVPREWVEESTADHVAADATTGYGYLWWLNSTAGHRIISARGSYGQYICIVPDLDLVVVTTAAGPAGQPAPWPILRDYIFPAIREAKQP